MLLNSIITNLKKTLKPSKDLMKPLLTNITTCGGKDEIIVVILRRRKIR
jgi:hypothetical protein